MELETHPESTPSSLSSVNSSPSIPSLQNYTTLSNTPDMMTPESLEAMNSPGFPTSHSPAASYHDSPHLEAEKRMSSGSLYSNPNMGEGSSSSSGSSFPPSLRSASADEYYTHPFLPDSFDLSNLNAGELDRHVSPTNGDGLFLDGATDSVSGGGISGISADSYQWWIAENLAPSDRDML